MKKLVNRKLLMTGVALLLVIGLAAGLALPGLAAPDGTTAARGAVLQSIVKGEVTAKGQSDFVLKNNKGETTVRVDTDTRFYLVPRVEKITGVIQEKIASVQSQLKEKVKDRLPLQKPNDKANALKNRENAGPKPEGKGILAPDDLKNLKRLGAEAAFADLAVGDTAVVYLKPAAETPAARIVLIVKKSVIQTINGTVEAVGNGSITIKKADNTTITLSYDGDTVFMLRGTIQVQAGQTARATYDSQKMLAKRVSINEGEG